MLQQTSSSHIRIKKSPNMQNSKLMRTGHTMGQSKYIEPFGKYFIDKNKDRLNGMNGLNNTTGSSVAIKDNDRYLVNVSKLQRMNNSHTAGNNQRTGAINRTLSSCVSNQDFPITSLQKQTSTSQSHRSNLLTVNLKRLPRLNSSTNGLNVSHNKIQILREDMEILAGETIDLCAHTRDFAISFGNTQLSLNQYTNQIQRQLKSKTNDLSKMVQQTMQNNKQRSQSLYSDCSQLKDTNTEIKNFLQLIQQKIQNIQNSLGLNTGHHKHFV